MADPATLSVTIRCPDRRHRWRRRLLVAGCLLLSGCSTLPDGRGWGEDVDFRPGWERVGAAARNAVTDPWVWVPLFGSAAIRIDDWDHRISDHARRRTPVFGSEEDAERWSDNLRAAAALVHYLSIVATPGGEEPGGWVTNKGRGLLVSVAAVSSTVQVTNGLKRHVGRLRPNGTERRSFPSGHTSSAAVHARLASRNLDAIRLSPPTRRVLGAGLHALSLGTSWSRVEAGWHYPADTLFGLALGHFVAAFFYDAFMGLETGPLAVTSSPQGHVMVQWRAAF